MESTGNALNPPPPEIKKENVEAALKADKGNEAQFLSFSVHEFTKKGDNYATLVAAVHVNFVLNGETQTVSYVVKYNPGRMKILGGFPKTLFKKEECFYRRVVHEIQSQMQEIGQPPLRIPQCFNSSLEEGHEVIFLEDLRPRGFKMCDRKKGMDMAHIKLVLEELARLHAASHLLKDRIPDLCEKYPELKLDWLNHGKGARETTQGLFSSTMDNVAHVLDRFKGYDAPKAWLLKNKERTAEMLGNELRREPPFDLLCHGDCWNNNVLFRYNSEGIPVEVMLIDLQLSRVASIATDLNYLFHTSLRGPCRKDNLSALLTDYHACFSSIMAAAGTAIPFSLSELAQEYRNHLPYGLLFGLIALVFASTEDEDEDDTTNVQMETDFHGSAKEKFDRVIEVNAEKRERLLSFIDEMTENKVIT